MPHVLGGVTLPADLLWVDEFAWTPVEQAREYTLDGSLILEEAVMQAGRPITLASGPDRAWVTRTTVAALYALAQAPAALALTLHDGRAFSVVFRHAERALEAEPVVPEVPSNDLQYRVTVRLTAV
ncbi:MAG: hypothetical protein AB1578_07060 [Thermodesulfobacteriota bacterium]